MPNQHAPIISDRQLLQLIKRHGPAQAAKITGLEPRGVKRRRHAIERKYHIRIVGPKEKHNPAPQYDYRPHSGILQKQVENGIVIIAGDSHYEPGYIPTMHRALVLLCKELKPAGIVLNGDICDLAALSRFDMIGWEDRHEVREELEWAQKMLHEIEKAAFRAWKAWPIGNHDTRYNTYIAKNAKELEGLPFTKLRDYFELWEPCWR